MTAAASRYGGWSVKHWDAMMGDVMGKIMGSPFDLLLGRRTYDIFSGYWPSAGDEQGAKPLNDATKYVVSASHPSLEWGPAELIEGDVPARISTLKASDGRELQVHGSGNLIQTLLRHNLVDRFYVWVFPVLIGSGKRLFADGTVPSGLTLVESHDVDDRRRDRHLRAGGRARHRNVRSRGLSRATGSDGRHSSSSREPAARRGTGTGSCPSSSRSATRRVAVDLPAGDDAAGWDEYATAIERAVEGRTDLILVAQSLAGFSAPIVAERRPVDLLVLVNAMIPGPGETGAAWWSDTKSREAELAYFASIGLAPEAADDVKVMYFHDVPADVVDEAFQRGEPAQSSTPMEQPWPLEAWPDVPTRILAGPR